MDCFFLKYILFTIPGVDDCNEKIEFVKKEVDSNNNLNLYFDFRYSCGVCAPHDKTFEIPVSDNENINEIKPILTPGHTEGHTIFQYKDVIFVGDLLKVKKGILMLMPKIMNWDEEEAKKSMKILKNLNFKWLCPAHGEPIKNGNEVKRFLLQY